MEGGAVEMIRREPKWHKKLKSTWKFVNRKLHLLAIFADPTVDLSFLKTANNSQKSGSSNLKKHASDDIIGSPWDKKEQVWHLLLSACFSPPKVFRLRWSPLFFRVWRKPPSRIMADCLEFSLKRPRFICFGVWQVYDGVRGEFIPREGVFVPCRFGIYYPLPASFLAPFSFTTLLKHHWGKNTVG